MDLAFNAEELAFQQEVRDWITANMPPEVAEEARRSRSSHVSKERLLQWQKKLAGKGWLCPNWPKEYGGTGWNSTQKFIFEMEMARADSPYLSSFSLKMVAPVLMKYGSDAQKKRFLPKIAAAEELWCQGYSRAGLGSDLASCARARERQGDHYIVNGQKIWTPTPTGPTGCSAWCAPRTRASAGGHLLPADRHEDARHQGRSDLPGRRHAHADAARGQPGVLHRREGAGREPGRRGEQGLDLRQVPARVRARRPGARAAPAQGLPPSADLAQDPARRGEPLSASPHWREKMAALEMEIDAVEMNELMFYSSLKTGASPATAWPRSSRCAAPRSARRSPSSRSRRSAGTARPFTELRNYDSNVVPVGGEYVDDVAPRYFNQRKTTIYGGSSEVQRNVLAKAMLGL
jgi:alkylation response protein AidB-like acyl-CoA dehydrogenase